MLAPFSKSLGVASYRQLLEEVQANKDKQDKAMRDIGEKVAQLENAVRCVAYHCSQDVEAL